MSVKERLITVIGAIQGGEELNISKFEKACSLSNGYVNSIRKSIGEESLVKILKEYPEINKIWLLHGEGEMFLKTDQKKPNNFREELREKKNSDKDFPAYEGSTRGKEGGRIEVYSDDPDMQLPVGYLPATLFPGCNHAEKISGSSMYPLIVSQGWCIGKIIDKRGMIKGEKYIIHTKYGEHIVKYVHPSDKGEQYIKIVSHNKKVPDDDIPLDDIEFCCRVLFIVNPS